MLASCPAPRERRTPASPAPLRRFVASDANLVLEYNPTRPRGRLRYSVAHELAHALFPDAGQDIRNRTHTGAIEQLGTDDSWQLELLCNVGAAELLMPTNAIEGLLNIDTDIDFLMAQRARFHVSTEAMLRRLVHATERPMALAAFNRVTDTAESVMRCEYVLPSRAWSGDLKRGDEIPPETPISAPTAVGQTAHGTGDIGGEVDIQAVGIPPYPRRSLPRVLALLESPHIQRRRSEGINFVTADIADVFGDAAPGPGQRVIVAHVVNDTARTWGGRGVAAALTRQVPDAAKAYRAWSVAVPDNLTLGNVHQVDVSAGTGVVTVASMVAQRGYGPSPTPRLSYVALARALEQLATFAALADAEVHMPRIGAGQSGGRWDLIEATIERTLLAQDVPVVVYTMPSPGGQGTSPHGGSRR